MNLRSSAEGVFEAFQNADSGAFAHHEPASPFIKRSDFGGWDKDAAKFLRDIARLDARRWAKNDAIEIKQFFERLSITLQRGNTSLLINRDADV